MTTAMIQAPFARSLATATGQHGAHVVKNAVHISSKSFKFNVTTTPPPTSVSRRFTVTASRSTKEEANSTSKLDTSEDDDDDDDVSFLLKLGAGSFAGAAAIKYGSILVPEITRPNIIQALIMISTPVIVSVLLLIKQSRVQQ